MTPEMGTLMAGLFFSAAAFAAKSGTGQYYAVSVTRRLTMKAAVPAVAAALYLGLFGVSYYLTFSDAGAALTGGIVKYAGAGMVIHMAIALLMAVWGAALLKASPENTDTEPKGMFAALLLALPCPVCASAIFLTVFFAAKIFPDAGLRIFVLMMTVFFGVKFFTLAALLVFGRRVSSSPERLLGGLMILIALYFLLCVSVAPNYAGAERTYRIALSMWRGRNLMVEYLPGLAVFGGIFLCGLAWGLMSKLFRKRI
jgi:predicted transporter